MADEKKLLEVYDKIKAILSTYNISVYKYSLIDYGIQFNVSIDDWSGILRLYQNKKGEIKIDYSQLKGINAERIQSKIETGRVDLELTKSQPASDTLGFPIIGTDESGKGDYFGPLVCAGIYVDKKAAKYLANSGIKDSKSLSDSKNMELAQKIMNMCEGNYAIIEISPEKYNVLYDRFRKEGKNLNVLLAWAHSKAIEEILLHTDCQNVLIDQFADEKVVLNKLQQRGRRLHIIQKHRAEENIAVASASILARARYLVRLSKLSNTYKIVFPKGSSDDAIEAAKTFIIKYGNNSLPKVAKMHFKTTAQVLSNANADK